MKIETQKLTIERLLSSPDVFSRCIGIISPDYFNPDIRPLIKFIVTYFNKYHAVPKLDYINAEFDIELTPRKMDNADVASTCDQIEAFCQQEALYQAIMDSGADVTSGNRENFGKVLERVQSALAVSIQKDLGIDLYNGLEQRLATYTLTDIYEPTGIQGLDDALGGGLARKQVTMFSANSGGGKSLMLSNLAANYSRRGFHVLQLALELTEQMIELRNTSIITGINIADWKTNIAEISGAVRAHKEAGAGSWMLKRIPGGSTANNIRSYLKLYEAEYGHAPDVLIVDYLDLMSPNGGTQNKGVFDQDKEKTEQLVEIAFDYNCIGITASQQNRDGVRNVNPDQAIIAGGISKINTVDNYISIYMNPEMRLKGELFIYYLKTRSSSAVGTMTALAFNPDNLIMSDKKTSIVSVLSAIKQRANNKKNQPITFPGSDGELVDIPDDFADVIERYHKEEETIQSEYSEYKPDVIDIADDKDLWSKPKQKLKLSPTDDYDELMALMSLHS